MPCDKCHNQAVARLCAPHIEALLNQRSYEGYCLGIERAKKIVDRFSSRDGFQRLTTEILEELERAKQ